MSDFDTYLNSIKHDKYGEDVRLSIQNGILELYNEGKAGTIDTENRELLAQLEESVDDISTLIESQDSLFAPENRMTIQQLELPMYVSTNGTSLHANLRLPYAISADNMVKFYHANISYLMNAVTDGVLILSNSDPAISEVITDDDISVADVSYEYDDEYHEYIAITITLSEDFLNAYSLAPASTVYVRFNNLILTKE